MSVKTVEMVRKIRDNQYEDMKGFTLPEQIKFIKKKSKRLRNGLKRPEHQQISKGRG
jgi:hypothetical protein